MAEAAVRQFQGFCPTSTIFWSLTPISSQLLLSVVPALSADIITFHGSLAAPGQPAGRPPSHLVITCGGPEVLDGASEDGDSLIWLSVAQTCELFPVAPVCLNVAAMSS